MTKLVLVPARSLLPHLSGSIRNFFMSLMRLGSSARALRVKYVSRSLSASVALLCTSTKSMNCMGMGMDMDRERQGGTRG